MLEVNAPPAFAARTVDPQNLSAFVRRPRPVYGRQSSSAIAGPDSACISLMFVFHKFRADIATNGRLLLNLGSHKNAELKNPLEFFGPIMPSVIIANGVGWKIVILYVLTAPTMRQNVIRLPIVACDSSAANMAPAASFR